MATQIFLEFSSLVWGNDPLWLTFFRWVGSITNWVFPKIAIYSDTPKWMIYNGKPYKNGWFGGTTIFGNIQLVHHFLSNISYLAPGPVPTTFCGAKKKTQTLGPKMTSPKNGDFPSDGSEAFPPKLRGRVGFVVYDIKYDIVLYNSHFFKLFYVMLCYVIWY